MNEFMLDDEARALQAKAREFVKNEVDPEYLGELGELGTMVLLVRIALRTGTGRRNCGVRSGLSPSGFRRRLRR